MSSEICVVHAHTTLHVMDTNSHNSGLSQHGVMEILVHIHSAQYKALGPVCIGSYGKYANVSWYTCPTFVLEIQLGELRNRNGMYSVELPPPSCVYNPVPLLTAPQCLGFLTAPLELWFSGF